MSEKTEFDDPRDEFVYDLNKLVADWETNNPGRKIYEIGTDYTDFSTNGGGFWNHARSFRVSFTP